MSRCARSAPPPVRVEVEQSVAVRFGRSIMSARLADVLVPDWARPVSQSTFKGAVCLFEWDCADRAMLRVTFNPPGDDGYTSTMRVQLVASRPVNPSEWGQAIESLGAGGWWARLADLEWSDVPVRGQS